MVRLSICFAFCFVSIVFVLRWRREAAEPPMIFCHLCCFFGLYLFCYIVMEAAEPPNISCHCFAVWFVSIVFGFFLKKYILKKVQPGLRPGGNFRL